MTHSAELLEEGRISFSVESRILRELGERLVKQPEVAILELIKNAYDADATECVVETNDRTMIVVTDDGHGMTLEQFRSTWMRVGTSARAKTPYSRRHKRLITGEKGIGRFAVRFLGERLKLTSVSGDPKRGRTALAVEFDWPSVDRSQDLGDSSVPYQLRAAEKSDPDGTRLEISRLRLSPDEIDWRKVQTGSIGVVSPLRALTHTTGKQGRRFGKRGEADGDPGFELKIRKEGGGDWDIAVATQILASFVLRARVVLSGDNVTIDVFEQGSPKPCLRVQDRFANDIGWLKADIRFFPRRPGTFSNASIDGRRAYSWIRENAGVAVFDRGFRVLPYGLSDDDWLQLQADAARNRREPRSHVAAKHFAMPSAEYSSTKLNWMLRLPQSAQLIGVVEVRGHRSSEGVGKGLIAAADREGFVNNAGFAQLYEVTRGAVEMLAVADRRRQLQAEEAERAERLERTREETRQAIEEVQSLPEISRVQKQHLVKFLLDSQQRVERQEVRVADRQNQMEVMSLLGVVAGYMTHEFDAALYELEKARDELIVVGENNSIFLASARVLGDRIRNLEEFVQYARVYVEGVRRGLRKEFRVRPRIRHVVNLLRRYAEERHVKIDIGVAKELKAPPVPATLYDGILKNLFTNALKAVTAAGGTNQRRIAFRAWNDSRWHYLQVSDNGVGIPPALRDRVFDPLFSTTESNDDALGSGMGLGLSLIQRGADAFGGRVELVVPPPEFSTCVEVRLPQPKA